jgi:hypothetical protein
MISLIELVTISSLATLTAAGASHGLNLLRQTRGIRSKSQARSNHDEESGRPSAGAWHEPRFGTRYAVDCRIEYLFECQQSEGRLVDMSRQGWRVKGLQPVAKGTTMTVQVYFSDSARPISIDEAIVRWTEGLEFGVELTRISEESAMKLRTYLATNFPAPDSSSTYALYPHSYN